MGDPVCPQIIMLNRRTQSNLCLHVYGLNVKVDLLAQNEDSFEIWSLIWYAAKED